MDNNKIMIVGTGNVGASIAFAIMNQRTVINEIVLTDIIAKDAEVCIISCKFVCTFAWRNEYALLS